MSVARPKILDLYCCSGAASEGYVRAGFDVEGVDIDRQPNYRHPFHRMSALSALADPEFMSMFDAVHGSPPCQASTALTKGTNKGRVYPQLIPATRELMILTGLPYVIENVQGADLHNPVTLCGEMFGLGVIRHRLFETSWGLAQPTHIKHRGRVRGWRHGQYFDGPYVAVYGEGGGKGSVDEWREAMGIDWTRDRRELAEAIPPAYTEHIGRQLIDFIREGVRV